MDIAQKIREMLPADWKVIKEEQRGNLCWLIVSVGSCAVNLITDGTTAEIALEYNDHLRPAGGGFTTLDFDMAISEEMTLKEAEAILQKLQTVDLSYPSELPQWFRHGEGRMSAVFGISELFGYRDPDYVQDPDLPF